MANVKTEEVKFTAPATNYIDVNVKIDHVKGEPYLTVDHKWNSRKFVNYAGAAWDKRNMDSDPVAKAGQATEELAKLIKNDGLISKPVARDMGDGRYFLVAGFRRLEAIKSLGWKEVPIRLKQMSESEARRINLEENQARKDLNSYELAMGCAEYAKALTAEGATRKGGTVEGGEKAQWSSRIASELAISKSAVTLYLRIVDGCHPKLLETWGDSSKPESALLILSRLEAYSKMPKDEQVKRFRNLAATGNEETAPDPNAPPPATNPGDKPPKPPAPPRMIKVEFALDALNFFKGEHESCKDSVKRQWLTGVIKTLEWTLGKAKQDFKGKQVLGMLGDFNPFAAEIQKIEDDKEAKAKADSEAKAKADATKNGAQAQA